MQKKDKIELIRDLKKAITGREKEFGDRVSQVLSGFRLIYLFIANLLLREILWLTRVKYQEPWVNASELILPWWEATSPGLTVWRGFTNSLNDRVKEIEEKGCRSVSLNRLALWIGWCVFCKWVEDCEQSEYKVPSLIGEYIQTAGELLPNTFLGYLLTLPSVGNLSNDRRLEAAQQLYKKHFPRPIDRRRRSYLKQDIQQELNQRAKTFGLPALDLSILGSILSLPKATYRKKRKHPWEEWRETKLGELPLDELLKNPEIMKAAIANLTTNDLAGPGWRSKHRHMPFEEAGEYAKEGERPAELEIAASIIDKRIFDEWSFDEINRINTGSVLEAKLESANLTPRERAIIEAKLLGTLPKGSPGSVKTAISRLRKKCEKK